MCEIHDINQESRSIMDWIRITLGL